MLSAQQKSNEKVHHAGLIASVNGHAHGSHSGI